MEAVKDSLIDLERHRRRLEENIDELRRALQHWQTWDAEYEALKEEVDSASDSSPEELERLRNAFEGELVNQKEVDEVFGQRGQRSKDQIINVLDRRIDYVTKSIEALRKQLEAAEKKYAAASIISQPDAQDDEGQPITEIVEELDDEDNVVSYKLNQPGETLPHVREALQKAGVKDIPSMDEDHPSSTSRISEIPDEHSSPKPNPQATSKDAGKASAQSASVPKKEPKKSVSFTEDTKPAAEADPPLSRSAARVENIMKTAKDQEKLSQNPIIPEGEAPEDADLRQEMLKYSMGEVGAVVAELELEEDQSGDEDDDWDYSDEGFDEDEDDEEDKYGRSKNRIVTDDYRQRMLELEQKLGIKSRFASQHEVEKDDDDQSGSDDERVGRIVVNHNAAPSSSASQPNLPKPATKGKQVNGAPEKKGVRFAESLDIAPENNSPPAPAASAVSEREPIVEPLSDIVERSGSNATAGAKTARKPSRFKKTREETSQGSTIPKGPLDVPDRFLDQDIPAAPSGPDGATLANKLVERDTVSRPMEDDEYDGIMDQQEVAVEHQRLRRKFIQRQGGFLKEDETPIQPLDETEGGQKRPSRFKAARLSKQ